MKKGLNFFYLFTIIFIILSIILSIISIYVTKNKDKKNKEKIEQENQEKQDIELKANETIRVKMSQTGEVVAMDINDYLRGVVPSEMPPDYNEEALKAQAIVARTYTYKVIQDKSFAPDADVTDSPSNCQAFYTKDKLFQIWKNKGFSQDTINDYWNKVTKAVNDTQNMVITYKGEYIKAYFHASSPDKTENVDQIWGGVSIPYLVSVESKEDPSYQWNSSTVTLSYDDFKNKVDQNIDKNFSLNNRSGEDIIKIDSYTTSGRVKNVKIGNDIVSAEKMRTIFGLRSTEFKIDLEQNDIKFDVKGNGHGIGMSQVGANYYANNGMSCVDIIKHYYTGVDVITLK